ncbi:MAG TPA: aminomethyl-transferring glycine dehydrogenase subunit GcvPB, partial [Hyphomonas sp.]|nr:aminomethyl-transferring glycine dehydrogenase subunit GcvPB [Hyphomonas sp.]
MNTQGRPTSPVQASSKSVDTVSGSKGLLQAEGLIFEIGTEDTTGVDLPKPKNRTG